MVRQAKVGLVTVLERNKVSVKFLLPQLLAGGLCLGLKGHCHAFTEVFLGMWRKIGPKTQDSSLQING